MKLRIQRDHFTAGLQQVLNVVGSRPSMPILSNVLLQAEGDRLTFTTTNLDMGIRCHIKAEVITPGALTLPARRLATIVKSLPQNEVLLDASVHNQAKITSGGSLFRIMGMAIDDFPPLSMPIGEHTLSLSPDVLQGMLRSVAYAQSTDENRYILNGVYFHFNAGKLSLVATDGRRLAFVSQVITAAPEESSGVILPAKTVGELGRVLNQGNMLRMTFNGRQVAFIIQLEEEGSKSGLIDDITLISKVVEGQFPNYKQVIPSETAQRIRIERELFLDCIERASFVSSDRHNAVKVRVSTNLLEVSGSSPEVGESHESMAISYEGPEVQVSFNPQFLMDPLKALVQDEVAFEFKDDLSPGVFKTSEDFLCVVMPLRSN